MRKFIRLTAAAFIAAAFVTVPAVSAMAAGYDKPDTPGITVDRDKVAPGESISFSGAGFAAGSPVDVRFGDTLVATESADSTGRVEGSFAVPAGTPTGDYVVELRGVDAANDPLVLAATVKVTSAGKGLPITGTTVLSVAFAGAGAAAGGMLLIGLARRRRGA